MRYDVLLADADGTLFNFRAGERAALTATFSGFGIALSDAQIALYSRINDGHWKRLERGETTQERLRVERFADFLAAMGARELSPEAVAAAFVDNLARQRVPMEGALDFVRAVSAKMPIYLVTNGIARVQRGRFESSELRPYLTDLLISEELGTRKPAPEMVWEALRRANVADRRRAVLLGDSVTADIAAANNAGVDSILFTEGAEPPEGHGATCVALSLADALPIVLS